MKVVLALLVALAAARFAYSVSRSAKGWSGDTYMDLVWNSQHESVAGATVADEGRWWGPMFFLTFGPLKAAVPDLATFDTLQRVMLVAVWLGTLAVFVSLMTPTRPGPWAWVFQALIVVIGLQSTPAIYAIAAGMGEVITAFCIVAHCLQFERRRYTSAAVLIVFGVYFKLWPILFLWPYLVFAALSPRDRPYWRAVILSVLAIGLVSLVGVGWWMGPMYPLTMMVQTLSGSTEVIPLTSREVFGLPFLVSRLITGFNAETVEATSPALFRALSVTFSLAMIVGLTVAGALFARSEPRWGRTPDGRKRGILMFQTVIGAIYISCAMDVSIAHLLALSVGLYGPWLMLTLTADTPDEWVTRHWRPALLFAAGAWLVGTLVPLSLVLRLFPLSVLNQWAGNAASGMIPQEQYMWYQVPLFGMYLLGAATWLVYARAGESNAGTYA